MQIKPFENSFKYKLIYIFKINDTTHEGLLKIGDTTIKTDESIDKLPPNCSALNKAAKERIKQYTNTAAINFKLLYTELAVRTKINHNGKQLIVVFRDKDVHQLLKNSGIKNVKKLNGTSGREWFKISLDTAKEAIKAVKENRTNLSGTILKDNHIPIVFRPEQLQAIEQTVKHFKNGNEMLWNAKMRFGKTLSALEVIHRCKFSKTIIITHRPVVDAGWYEDFNKIFISDDNYVYGSKNSGTSIENLLNINKNFVYFTSMQDLRGSKSVGGKFEKNNIIFEMNWDLVIVDEAHEGTTTALGDEVITKIVKKHNGYDTKFLALSGTPFNILNNYTDNIYTWDYIMEQKSKYEWDKQHFGDSNPYDDLPKMYIYTYNLGEILPNNYIELEDKAFNFREFFRTWTGDVRHDFKPIPPNAHIGDFVHADDVLSFLNLITTANNYNNYPFASKEYRDLFRHTLWVVPGVREAKALSRMMSKHPVFGNGAFKIVNVAGDGDEDEENKNALELVKNAIRDADEDGYTITLSCGKLTTGVTIKEWTAVMLLAGSSSTSSANYLQTIFRVQSPCNKNGKIKTCCYVFDFAPDRTLKMITEAVAISTKAGKQNESDKRILGEFLNYCPVISVNGTNMQEYDTNKLLQQLKRAYAERAVKNGFDDNCLYNDELLKLQDIDLENFKKLKGIIGTTKASLKTNEVDINNQGFTDEEYKEIERINKKAKKERTPEEIAKLEELKKKKKQKNDAISILRGISIRMPLLIYGADIPVNEDVTMETLLEKVDPSSWKEFMPEGVTKSVFKNFIRYYDKDVFVSAGRRIRNIAKSADNLSPTERVIKIADLFSCFKNPDKETVLTPWRVVNMHMSDCLGGYDFFDEKHEHMLDKPRFINQGTVTTEVLKNDNVRILEINSKTGLYPLYVTYSVYRHKLEQKLKKNDKEITIEEETNLWLQTVKDNIFVICKTPMAKSITIRTLIGYKDGTVNTHHFKDLINYMKNKQEKFIKRVLSPKYWEKDGKTMKFDAIVGNPPYQVMDGGYGASSTPIYQYFVEQAKKLNPEHLSMIMPARWYIGGRGLDKFREKMLSDNHISLLVDYPKDKDIFPTVDIAGGLCYFRWDKNYIGDCLIKNKIKDNYSESLRSLNEFPTLIRDNNAINIVRKVKHIHSGKFMDKTVYPSRPFGIRTNYIPQKSGIPCQFIQKIGRQYANPKDISDDNNILNKWKFLVPRAPIAGQTDFTKPIAFYYDNNVFIAEPGCCCTESFIVLFTSNSKEEIYSFKSYLFTKIVRFLLLQSVISQDIVADKWKYVPALTKYTGKYTDEKLMQMWHISEEEFQYIDSRIKNV